MHCDSNWEVFRIERDEQYFNTKTVPAVRRFFFESYLAELVDSRIQSDLAPREPQHVIDARRAKGLPLPFDQPGLLEEEEEDGAED